MQGALAPCRRMAVSGEVRKIRDTLSSPSRRLLMQHAPPREPLARTQAITAIPASTSGTSCAGISRSRPDSGLAISSKWVLHPDWGGVAPKRTRRNC